MSAAAQSVPTAAQLREALGARGSAARCPAHDDKQASLSISENRGGSALVKCHAGCSQEAVIAALQGRGIWPKPQGLTVAELAAAKGLPEQLMGESGFTDEEQNGRPIVRIAYRGDDGELLCVRYRGAAGKDSSGPRFWFRRGDKQQLFGLWRLKSEPVILVEGETDALALWAAGFNALGVPGADAWREDRFAPALKEYQIIYVHVEPDAGGEKFRTALGRSRLREHIRFFTVAPAAKDPCELRARDPDGFRVAIEELLEGAKAAGEELPEAHDAKPEEPPASYAAASVAPLTDTDIANAQRFARQHGENVRFTPERGWYVWDGRRWAHDEKLIRVQELGKRTALAIYDEVKSAPNRDELYAHAKRSQSRRAIESMVWLARSEPGIPVRLTEFDANGWLLNVANGTLDLKTGALRAHRREDLISNLTEIVFDPNADVELWDSFLWRVTDRNDELYAYLRRFVGYLLVADTSDQSLHFLYGLGANGKSVFCEVLQRLLGDYAITVSPDLIMLRRHGGIPNDVARLRGVRAALMNETTQGAKFDEAKLKDLTGGDTLTARFLHQEFFDFRPSHRIVIRGNHKPAINGTDEGIWRRLRLVPFTVSIPADEQDCDLLKKLEVELPGILHWALAGC
ncbi:MAG: phage/plasmid primase, P4 family, partial [Steroidobacteraceae bacterium]